MQDAPRQQPNASLVGLDLAMNRCAVATKALTKQVSAERKEASAHLHLSKDILF